MRLRKLDEVRIAIIGLGYVGLPLALTFSKKFKVKGYDINQKRINELQSDTDLTRQVSSEELKGAQILFTSALSDIEDCNIYIVTVPTPVNEFKHPDLTAILAASAAIGQCLKKGDIIIYESTVYPGCTEEECIPILERTSALKLNEDFFCGYSPERISPGDTRHHLTEIVKVTSGSTPEAAHYIDQLYSSIINAGTYKVSSIKVAEAAKAIENAQRDVNISFVNELALIFDRIGIDTTEVIEAAATKWNFLKFKPGLVGGHCIGVDPYYLTHKAESLGYRPQVILSGRRVNDYIATFIVNKVIKLMIAKGSLIKDAKVLILGITFKENCPDVRNSKVIDIYKELQQFGIHPQVYDPVANVEDVKQQYNIDLISDIYNSTYNAIILAVCHKEFLSLNYQLLKKENTIIFDTKSALDRTVVDARL